MLQNYCRACNAFSINLCKKTNCFLILALALFSVSLSLLYFISKTVISVAVLSFHFVAKGASDTIRRLYLALILCVVISHVV